MGKITGFMELQRIAEVADPINERVRHYREFIHALDDAAHRVILGDFPAHRDGVRPEVPEQPRPEHHAVGPRIARGHAERERIGREGGPRNDLRARRRKLRNAEGGEGLQEAAAVGHANRIPGSIRQPSTENA